MKKYGIFLVVIVVLIGSYSLIYKEKIINSNTKLDNSVVSSSTPPKMEISDPNCKNDSVCAKKIDDSLRLKFEEKTIFEKNLTSLGFVRHPIAFEEFSSSKELRIPYEGTQKLFADFSAIVNEKDYDSDMSSCLQLVVYKDEASKESASVQLCENPNLIEKERKTCDKYEVRGKAELTLTDVSEGRRGISAPALSGKIINFKVVGTPTCNLSL